MWMIRHIGVEIAFRAIHSNFTHQTRITKGPQSIIDRSQRDLIGVIIARSKQAFGGYMPIFAIPDQAPRQNHPLPRWTQPALGQPLVDEPMSLNLSVCVIHGLNMTPWD